MSKVNMGKTLQELLLAVLLLLLCSFSYRQMVQSQAEIDQKLLNRAEVLYLPSGQALQFVSFGYQHVLANLLWFKTISYFGKHFRTDHDYTWLKHMCNLVTELDPRKRYVYEFCSLMLAWEGNDLPGAMEILDRALQTEPDYWRYYYLRGINHAFFLKDERAAQQDFYNGSQKPAAPPFMVRLAAKKLSGFDSPENAIAFLNQMIAEAKDENQRAAFAEYLKKSQNELNLRRLNEVLERYLSERGALPARIEDLLPYGIEQQHLKEPFGGDYFIDKEKGVIKRSLTADSPRT